MTWGILHRYPDSYNEELGIYTWRYYPLRDSVYVNREEAPYADQGIGAYQKTDQLRMVLITVLVLLSLRQ